MKLYITNCWCFLKVLENLGICILKNGHLHILVKTDQ